MPPATSLTTKIASTAVAAALIGVAIGYQLAAYRLQPLAPPFAFTNATSTIEASGAWMVEGNDVSNATGIFCWLPGNACQVVVAELVPDGSRSRFKLVEKSLSIVQLSDTSVTATSTSTDPCQVETLHIEREARTALLSVGPSDASGCAPIETFNAFLGG